MSGFSLPGHVKNPVSRLHLMRQLLSSLGVSVNWEKSILILTQTIAFLGATRFSPGESLYTKGRVSHKQSDRPGYALPSSSRQNLSLSPWTCGSMHLHYHICLTPPTLPSDMALNNVLTNQTQHEYCDNNSFQSNAISNVGGRIPTRYMCTSPYYHPHQTR